MSMYMYIHVYIPVLHCTCMYIHVHKHNVYVHVCICVLDLCSGKSLLQSVLHVMGSGNWTPPNGEDNLYWNIGGSIQCSSLWAVLSFPLENNWTPCVMAFACLVKNYCHGVITIKPQHEVVVCH